MVCTATFKHFSQSLSAPERENIVAKLVQSCFVTGFAQLALQKKIFSSVTFTKSITRNSSDHM